MTTQKPFYYISCIAMPQHKKLNYEFYCKLSLSDLCPGVEKVLLLHDMLHDQYGKVIVQEPLPRGSLKI